MCCTKIFNFICSKIRNPNWLVVIIIIIYCFNWDATKVPFNLDILQFVVFLLVADRLKQIFFPLISEWLSFFFFFFVFFAVGLNCARSRRIRHCWQITATHQTNLNKRPVEILVGDIYSPRTLISQSAAEIHTTE